MGATRFLKEYSQEKVQQALEEGFSIGVVGKKEPETNLVMMPHEIKPAHDPPWDCNGEIIGYNINRVYPTLKGR